MYRQLISLRAYNNKTQAQMAEFLGISLVSYNHKENGKTQFKKDEMEKIANYFGKTVDEIFFK